MAVISSPTWEVRTKTCRSKTCKACGLYLNQAPIYDEKRVSDVFWVGLSAVLFAADAKKLPLSSSTSSGALIHQIEAPYRKALGFYKTNLVKCVPLKEDRIRYPLEQEMEKCYPNFEAELKELHPNTVFLLGKQVATFVLKKLASCRPVFNEDFEFDSITIDGVRFIPIHHPSYVLVYKRKNLSRYIESIQKLFPKSAMFKMQSAAKSRLACSSIAYTRHERNGEDGCTAFP